jgi:hypothetical protein
LCQPEENSLGEQENRLALSFSQKQEALVALLVAFPGRMSVWIPGRLTRRVGAPFLMLWSLGPLRCRERLFGEHQSFCLI